MEMSGVLHGPVALLTEKELAAPTEQRKGGSQSRSGHFGEEKDLLPLPEVLKRPTRRLATIPTELSQNDVPTSQRIPSVSVTTTNQV
jgi:hypothetical protein